MGEIMNTPNVDQSLNLEFESLDELERKVAPEQTDETVDWTFHSEHSTPAVGNTCRRQSQRSELSACEIEYVAN